MFDGVVDIAHDTQACSINQLDGYLDGIWVLLRETASQKMSSDWEITGKRQDPLTMSAGVGGRKLKAVPSKLHSGSLSREIIYEEGLHPSCEKCGFIAVGSDPRSSAQESDQQGSSAAVLFGAEDPGVYRERPVGLVR